MSDELLPCPFCLDGGNPKSKHVNSVSGTYPNGYYWAGCEINLSATVPTTGCGVGHSKITEREAIAAWNRRAPLLSPGVVPDAEIENAELFAVMVSVDKWFNEGDSRLSLNPATRAGHAREIALQEIERLEERLAILKEWQSDVIEREGACCPEDVGFDEYIGILHRKLTQFREALTLAKRYSNFDPLSDQTIIRAIDEALK